MRSFFAAVAVVLSVAVAAQAAPSWQAFEPPGAAIALETPVDLVRQPTPRVEPGEIAPQIWMADHGDLSLVFMVQNYANDAALMATDEAEFAEAMLDGLAADQWRIVSRGDFLVAGGVGRKAVLENAAGVRMDYRVVARRPYFYNVMVMAPREAHKDLEGELVQRFLNSLRLKPLDGSGII